MIKEIIDQLTNLGVSKDHQILLAVSGGVDSMVLMDLLFKNEFKFLVAHCNFSLRGQESDLDQKFVELTSKSMGVKCFTKLFQTKAYSFKKQISIQMAARELRYDWFNKIKNEYNCDFIVTAHHTDDSVETVLMNLIKGTGFQGLHGIKPKQTHLIRPMLNFTKKSILSYAKKNVIAYREDSSNIDNKYIRNKIRNKIIPIMREINPNVVKSIGETISRVNDVENIYQNYISSQKKILIEHSNQEFKIDIKKLKCEIAPKQLLYEIISDFGFSDIDAIYNSIFSDSSGKEFFNSEFYMIKDRNKLIISKHLTMDNVVIYEKTKNINHPFKMSFSISSNFSFSKISKSNRQFNINYSKLQFPLLIRPWQHGDVFMPFGMNKFKKVSDYFIDKKFSLIDKKKSRLLISNNNVVCIIGERLDDRFKLVENSEKVYIVKL